MILCFSVSVFAETVTVKTKAPKNRNAVFHYRVPKGYDAKKGGECRVLVIFGGRNTDGRADASGRLGWGAWCDQRDIFIVAPGLRDDKYWEPDEWSGRALQKALGQIAKKYRISTSRMFFYGYSAGSQASNLFPAWKPELCRAWVSHACGVFHQPSAGMRGIPGLVTCGDADKARYIISRNFVENARKKGVDVIWKSFPNHPHDVPPGSLELARAFFAYQHELYAEDLRGSAFDAGTGKKGENTFVGDDQEQKFYEADSPAGKNIFPEDRVVLPDLSVAKAWGVQAK